MTGRGRRGGSFDHANRQCGAPVWVHRFL